MPRTKARVLCHSRLSLRLWVALSVRRARGKRARTARHVVPPRTLPRVGRHRLNIACGLGVFGRELHNYLMFLAIVDEIDRVRRHPVDSERANVRPARLWRSLHANAVQR